MRKVRIGLMAMAFLFGFGFQSAIADTEVSGNITSDTTWTVAGSPYIVVGTVQVLEGATLTIEPWVTVKFNAGMMLEIDGELIARGTEPDSVFFTSNSPTPQPGDWGGIRFHGSQGSRLEYCRIEYGGTPDYPRGGVVCLDSSSPLISHTTIAQCADAGISTCHSFPYIMGNAIVNNKITYEVSPGRRAGIYCNEGFPIIANNLIAENEGRGISCYSSGLIFNNTIIENLTMGIVCEYSPAAITNNIICWNHTGIEVRGQNPSPSIAYNDVWDNLLFDFLFCPSGVGDTTWTENINGTPCDSFYNIVRDPFLCNPDSGNYYLAENSPCLGAGQDSLGNPVDIGAFGVGCPPLGINEEKSAKTPQRFSLLPNFPNPFNPLTQIGYTLPRNCWVRLEVYNILGQKMATLVDERQAVGYQAVHWDSRSQTGNEVASGIYFYHLQAGDFVETRRMVLLR